MYNNYKNMGFTFNTFKSGLRDFGHTIAPAISPIKTVWNATTKPILAGISSIGTITTNLFHAGSNLSGTAVSLTSGNTLYYIAGGILVLGVVYYVNKK